MLRAFTDNDFPALLALWNRLAPDWGYTRLDEGAFRALFAGKWDCCYLYGDAPIAFACGAKGFLSCLLADPKTLDGASALLDAMEAEGYGRISFFDPIHLPWVIPGTPGHIHNNCPGADVEGSLYPLLLKRGWRDTHRECAMYLNLAHFPAEPFPEGIAWYNAGRHYGLEDTVYAQGNPDWNAEMPLAARERNMLTALDGDRVVGCAGPVYPEESGRGYFAGIMVHPDYQGKGYGRRLFYALCTAEKQAGAEYMSLFTGKDNPAGKIYRSAGFRTVKEFALMELGG